ncbi:MAG: AraC family transcriptional regulator, partial [Victivallaceae bacterium]|nr:AraC family transcriptional regulator [Victivallaceae bacterium]
HFNFWIFGSLDVFNLIDFNSCRIKPDHEFRKCFQLLVEEFSRNNIGSFLQCIRYLSSLIEPFLMEADTRDLFEKAKRISRFKGALETINEKYDQNPDLEKLAKSTNWTPHYFSRMFKDTFGCTAYQYLINQKVARAKNLLLNSNRSIKEIAELCGFEDPYYFSRIFKKKEFVSPRQYRRNFSKY